MKYYKLHLIRHGLTAGNLQGLYIGSGSDLPLCDEGRAQLKTLKKYIQRGNSVILHPFNPAYEELVIKGEELDHLYIAGKVVETKAKW